MNVLLAQVEVNNPTMLLGDAKDRAEDILPAL